MAAWANLSSMRLFHIQNNSMTGTLPNELAAAWPLLTELVMARNRLGGEVPMPMHRAVKCLQGMRRPW